MSMNAGEPVNLQTKNKKRRDCSRLSSFCAESEIKYRSTGRIPWEPAAYELRLLQPQFCTRSIFR